MLQKMVTGTILGTICAVSGYLIADQIPKFDHLWWAGYAGGAAGLAVVHGKGAENCSFGIHDRR